MRLTHYAALLLASALFALNAQAQFEFVTNNTGTITITRYTGPGGDLMIPATINGLPVTCIGHWVDVMLPRGAFEGCNVTSVLLPNTITEIRGGFWFCGSLTRIYFTGNAPSVYRNEFIGIPATIYYLPWTLGWGPTLGGLPAIPWSPMEWLGTLVEESALRNARPFLSSLDAAQRAIERGNLASASNQLRAFQNKVRAQVADKELARQLIEAAEQVLAAM